MSDTPTIDPNVLNDVIVCQCGEAKGHEFEVDEDFCKTLTRLGNAAGAVKVRINHPEGRGDVLSIVGQAEGFYDSTCLDDQGIQRACSKVRSLRVYNLPGDAGQKIIALARQASQFFGMSIDAVVRLGKKGATGLKTAILEELHAIDFVDCPAATSALFSTLLDGQGHIRLSSRVVNSPKSEPAVKPDILKVTMAEKSDKEMLQELSARLDAYEKKHSEMSAKLARLEEGDKDKEKKDGEKKDADMAALSKKVIEDVVPAVMAKLDEKVKDGTTREFTALLAKTGGKFTDKNPPAPTDDEPTLTPEQKQIAVTLGVDPKVYAKNLEAARKQVSL